MRFDSHDLKQQFRSFVDVFNEKYTLFSKQIVTLF